MQINLHSLKKNRNLQDYQDGTKFFSPSKYVFVQYSVFKVPKNPLLTQMLIIEAEKIQFDYLKADFLLRFMEISTIAQLTAFIINKNTILLTHQKKTRKQHAGGK